MRRSRTREPAAPLVPHAREPAPAPYTREGASKASKAPEQSLSSQRMTVVVGSETSEIHSSWTASFELLESVLEAFQRKTQSRSSKRPFVNGSAEAQRVAIRP